MTDIDKFKTQFVTLYDHPPFFLHFLEFLRHFSSQPNKPYIHFVALEKAHLLSYNISHYIVR